MGQDHDDHHTPEKDEITGVYTTGHSWDGIKELNNPLPRWWVIVIWGAIIYGFAYTIFYPAWPGIQSYTKGIWHTSARTEVEADILKAKSDMQPMFDKIAQIPLQDIMKNPQLQQFALMAGGKSFAANCVACHGAGGGGAVAFPNLRDDDWLWGGSLDQIHQTISYGIRNQNDQSRQSQMPAFGKDGLLTNTQIRDVAEYVVSLSGQKVDSHLVYKGKEVFEANCISCHGEGGKGNIEMGAPRLSDQVWLYQGDRQSIMNQIYEPRHGIMPVWSERLDPATIKTLAVYVYSMSAKASRP
jgi:cytochrome c oxidase cbb3-type subunit III